MPKGHLSSEVYSLSSYKKSFHSPDILQICKHNVVMGDPVYMHVHNTYEGCATEMGYAKHTHLHLHRGWSRSTCHWEHHRHTTTSHTACLPAPQTWSLLWVFSLQQPPLPLQPLPEEYQQRPHTDSHYWQSDTRWPTCIQKYKKTHKQGTHFKQQSFLVHQW